MGKLGWPRLAKSAALPGPAIPSADPAQVTIDAYCYGKAGLATTTKHEATTEAPGVEDVCELSGALHVGDM
jgi:hypothetical protein